MPKKFSDFKNLHYDKTPRKLNLLKEIFSRLNIEDLEERYNDLLARFNLLEVRQNEFITYFKDNHVPEQPEDVGDPTPIPEDEFIFNFVSLPNPTPHANTLIAFHAHNPENKEVGSIVVSSSSPTFRISATLKFNNSTVTGSPAIIEEHGELTEVTSGTYNVTVEYNGLIFSLGSRTFEPNTTIAIIVTIPRIYAPLPLTYSGQESNWFPGASQFPEFSSTTPIAAAIEKTYPIPPTGNWDFDFSISPNSFSINLSLSINAFAPFGTLILSVYDLSTFIASYPDVTIDIPIFSFTRWFCQSIQQGDYPFIILSHNTGAITLNPNASNTSLHYEANFFDANKNYNILNFSHATISILVNNLSSPFSASTSISGMLTSDFKMTSVPFDLLGTGF